MEITPFSKRLSLRHETRKNLELASKKMGPLIDTVLKNIQLLNEEQKDLIVESYASLAYDVMKIEDYNKCSDTICFETFLHWFVNDRRCSSNSTKNNNNTTTNNTITGNCDDGNDDSDYSPTRPLLDEFKNDELTLREIFSWLRPERDYALTSQGVNVLAERYARKRTVDNSSSSRNNNGIFGNNDNRYYGSKSDDVGGGNDPFSGSIREPIQYVLLRIALLSKSPFRAVAVDEISPANNKSIAASSSSSSTVHGNINSGDKNNDNDDNDKDDNDDEKTTTTTTTMIMKKKKKNKTIITTTTKTTEIITTTTTTTTRKTAATDYALTTKNKKENVDTNNDDDQDNDDDGGGVDSTDDKIIEETTTNSTTATTTSRKKTFQINPKKEEDKKKKNKEMEKVHRRDLSSTLSIRETMEKRFSLKLCRLFYDNLSLGFVHVSSIYSEADMYRGSVDKDDAATTTTNNKSSSSSINPAEACRLIVCKPNYDAEFVKQIEKVCTIVSLGVGIGLGASYVPLRGKNESGRIRLGFDSFVKKLDSCNSLSLHVRRPKIAVYIFIDNDTVETALDLKRPNKEGRLENVFIGLMISDRFMRQVKNDGDWYLFPGDLRWTAADAVATDKDMINTNRDLVGRSLRDFDDDPANYERLRAGFVERRLYTARIKARTLMTKIIVSLCNSGSPYIVWIDAVNRYNNQRHLGPIHTLNLCAEITNYANDTDWSSCTLAGVNLATFEHAYETVARWKDLIENDIKTRLPFDVDCFDLEAAAATTLAATSSSSSSFSFSMYSDRKFIRDLLEYAYTMGYATTWMLNNVLGAGRARREIAVSPLGMFDAALLAYCNARIDERFTLSLDELPKFDPTVYCSLISEAMYRGCLTSSCDYGARYNIECKNYPGSGFSRGEPQWVLREKCYRQNDEFTQPTKATMTELQQQQQQRFMNPLIVRHSGSTPSLLHSSPLKKPAVKPNSDWTELRRLMTRGMANSMLVAQAPTATTSLLFGVTESVTIPMARMMTRQSANGRDKVIAYAFITNALRVENILTTSVDNKLAQNYRQQHQQPPNIVSHYIDEVFLHLPNDIRHQVAMYAVSAPYVDQSQSTMFHSTLDKQQIFDLCAETFKHDLKTGIYYINARKSQPTLPIIRKKQHQTTKYSIPHAPPPSVITEEDEEEEEEEEKNKTTTPTMMDEKNKEKKSVVTTKKEEEYFYDPDDFNNALIMEQTYRTGGGGGRRRGGGEEEGTRGCDSCSL